MNVSELNWSILPIFCILLSGCIKPDGENPLCEEEGRVLSESELINRGLKFLPGAARKISGAYDGFSAPETEQFRRRLSLHLRELIESGEFLTRYPDCCRLMDRESVRGEWTNDPYLPMNYAYKGLRVEYFVSGDFLSSPRNISISSTYFINNCGTTSKIDG